MKNTTEYSSSRCAEAVMRFMERNGCEFIELMDNGFDMVLKDYDGEFVFASITATEMGSDIEDCIPTRTEFERHAFDWLMNHDEAIDMGFRLDSFRLFIGGGDKAILRHHRNVMGSLGSF